MDHPPAGLTMKLESVFRRDDGVNQLPASLEWSIFDLAPDLAQHVEKLDPSIRPLADGIAKSVPFLRTVKVADAPPFVRPVGHGRSQYLRLDNGGVLAFKGTEVVADDYEQGLAQMAKERDYLEVLIGDISVVRADFEAEISRMDRWPILERKVSGVVSFYEARNEAQIALDFQRAYLARYGELARVPFPLLVLRWPDEVVESVKRSISKYVCERGVPVCEAGLKEGLGVYVYYYPTLPVRLQHLDLEAYDPKGLLRQPASPFARKYSYRARAEGLKELGVDAKTLLDRWIQLTVRALALGFMPKDPASLVSADCLQAWNIVLDGGIVDLDSLQKISAVRDDREFNDVLRRTVRELTINALLLMMGWPFNELRFRDRVPEVHWIVWSDVVRRLGEERKNGPIDPRLERLLEPKNTPNDLERLLTSLFP